MNTSNPSRNVLRSRQTLRVLFSILTLTGLIPLGSSAATLSWSGASATTSNWSDSDNWGLAGTPANGDTLIFPAGQPRLANVNDLGALTLNEIRFVGAGGGYSISGGTLTVTNRIQATNTAGGNSLFNNLVFTSPNLPIIVSNGVSLTFGGSQSSSGGFVKAGTGTLKLDGPNSANTYFGDTVVNEGVLELASLNVIRNGTLVIGDTVGGANADVVRFLSDYPIFGGVGGVTVVIKDSGLLDLNNFDDDVGPINFDGSGNLTTGTGTLILFPPVRSYGGGFANLSGNMEFESGTANFFYITNTLNLFAALSGTPTEFIKTGSGVLVLHGNNTYSGLTVVQRGRLDLQNGQALGDTASGTVVSNLASLVLQTTFGVTNESLTLNGFGQNSSWGALDSEPTGTNFWTGPITLNANSTIAPYNSVTHLRLSGVISGPGGMIVSTETGAGTGSLYLDGSSANTYAGTTTVNGGTLVLNKTVFDGAVPGNLIIGNNAGADTVRNLIANQIANTATVTINNLAILDHSGFTERFTALDMTGGTLESGAGTFFSRAPASRLMPPPRHPPSAAISIWPAAPPPSISPTERLPRIC